MPNIGGFFKKAAPWIAAAAGSMVPGPIGMAAREVSAIIGKPVPSNPDDINKAVEGMTPEQIAALQDRDQQFKLTMNKMGFEHEEELEKIAADDRADARAREVAVRDNTPRNLAYIYAGFFIFTLAAEICMAIWAPNVNQLVMKSVDLLLGAELGMVLGSKEYYFGSSAGSDKKNEIISNLSK